MFIYTLPIFFTHIRLISPIEGLIIMMGLFIFIYIVASDVESSFPQPTANYLFSAWIGTEALKSVFWPFFLILNGLLYGVDKLVKSGHATVSSWDDIHFILLFPIIWWTISVWRCSVNTDLKIWAAGSRLATIGVFLEYALKIYIRIYYPRIFFNCEDLLLDYGSCF